MTRATTARPAVEGGAPAPATPPRARHASGGALPLWAALVLAAASGPILDAAFPDRGIWPLAFAGIALVLVSLRGRSAGGALLVGFVAGAAFFFTHIQWASLFLGPLPMSALSVVMALFVAAGSLAIALAYRWLPRAWPGPGGRWLLPVVVAGLWTAREAWSSVWPYGGFAWGRVAQSQSESPFAHLFAYLGISGVTFVMVVLVAAAIELIPWGGRPLAVPRTTAVLPRATAVLPRATAVLGAACVLLLLPAWPVQTDSTVRVAAVQGNGKAGYFDQRERGDLLQAQLDATTPLFGERVDMVVWPEGSSDLSPLSDPYAASVFDHVAQQMEAPLVAGVVTERDGNTYNTELLWEAGRGATDFYDKRHPVPFGEYVPDRAFWRPFAPDLIDLIGRDYTPGTTDMVMDVAGTIVGVNICFDIVDDQILTETVEQGATMIVASTNNADFGRTDESAQQLAFARIRAIELGRSIVNISTVGISAVIAPDGSTIAELPWYTAGAMIVDVPLSSTITPAVVLGREVEWLASGLGLAGLVVGWAFGRRRG